MLSKRSKDSEPQKTDKKGDEKFSILLEAAKAVLARSAALYGLGKELPHTDAAISDLRSAVDHAAKE